MIKKGESPDFSRGGAVKRYEAIDRLVNDQSRPLLERVLIDELSVHKMPPSPDRWKERSKTYEGIAAAMAEQWGAPIDKDVWIIPLGEVVAKSAGGAL